jgi:hypothetical protein
MESASSIRAAMPASLRLNPAVAVSFKGHGHVLANAHRPLATGPLTTGIAPHA